MVETSENVERVVVAVVAGLSAATGALALSPLPENIKILVCPVLGALAAGIGAFWSKYINPSGA